MAYLDPAMPSLVDPTYAHRQIPPTYAPYHGTPYPAMAAPAWPSSPQMDVWPGQAPVSQPYQAQGQPSIYTQGNNASPNIAAPTPQAWDEMRPPSIHPYPDPPPLASGFVSEYPPAGFSNLQGRRGTPYPGAAEGSSAASSSYEPSTGQSAFNNALQLFDRGSSTTSSPVLPRSAFALSPQPSRPQRSKSLSDTLVRHVPINTTGGGRWYDRPGNWRPDFNMPRSGLGALFPSLKRGKSLSRTLSDAGPHLLNGFIRYSALRLGGQPVVYDLRDDLARIIFRDLKRPVTGHDLTHFTTEPPLPFMRLYHPHLPWYIDVQSGSPVGVTLFDLFDTMYRTLHSQISKSDFYNNDVTTEERQRVSDAYKFRCHNDPRRLQKGIRKVDFLLREFIFIGLAKGKDGMWEIKTRTL